MWILTASLSALFAGITAILAKCGIRNTDSDLATAIRTGIVLIFSWIMVLIVGSFRAISGIGMREILFLVLSGAATGISSLCYFRALSLGSVNQVAPVDKSSSILTSLLAIAIFHETDHLWIKLICTLAIFVGTLLMIQKNEQQQSENKSKKWLMYAILSAVFAALTSIFAKIGLNGIESNLGTAIRTAVVLVIAWAIVFAKKKHRLIPSISRRDLLFIVLSGITTGASWLCYYNAIQTGVVSVVVPIDKLSILITVGFSVLFLKEKLRRRAWAGLLFIVCGTICMTIFA